MSQRYGSGAHFTALLGASSAVGYRVYLPKVALEEIVANFERDFSENANKADQSLSKLSRLIGRPVVSPVEGFNSKEETEAFRDRLLDRLNKAGAQTVDYPVTSHESLVKRATSRRRPFDDKGSGYRDALIWESVLELATQVDGTIVLVTNDKDFRDGSSDLHGDLVDDLKGLGLPENKVVLAADLSGLVDEHVRPMLGTVPWESPLLVLAQGGINLEDAVAQILQDACSGEEWEPRELGIPYQCESPTLDMVEDVSSLTVLDIRQLDSNQVLVKVEADAVAQFDVFVYKPDVYTMDHDRLTVVDSDWNDHYVLGALPVSLHCNIDLVIDTTNPEQQEIRSVSVALQPND